MSSEPAIDPAEAPVVRRRLGAAARRLEAGLVACHLLPGHDAYRRFIVVSRARSGSNLLLSLLRSHPDVEVHGELFRRLEGTDPTTTLSSCFERKPRRIAAVGCKVFYYHPLDGPGDQLWAALEAMEGLHIVHLRRRNVLRTLTSRRLAELTDDWVDQHGRSGAAKPIVRFDPGELTRAFEQSEAWEEACRQRFRDHPYLEVAYEDLAAGADGIGAVTDFLGLRARPLSTPLHRQNPEPLRDLVADFDALRADFASTRWSWFFDS